MASLRHDFEEPEVVGRDGSRILGHASIAVAPSLRIRLDASAIIDGGSNTLLAAKGAFSRLYRLPNEAGFPLGADGPRPVRRPAALVPPRRAKLVRYFGVFAPNARLRR